MEIKAPKTVKMDGPVSVAKMPEGMSPGQLTSLQIKELMANAQRTIEERKRQLEMERKMKLGGATFPPPGVIIPPVVAPPVVVAPQLSEEAATAEAQAFDGKLSISINFLMVITNCIITLEILISS